MQLPDNLFIDVEEEGLKAFKNKKWNAVDYVIMNKSDIIGENINDSLQFEGGDPRLSMSGSAGDI